MDFDERWRRWLDEIVDSPVIAPDLLKAMSLGLRLPDLREVAESFHQNYDQLISDLPQEPNPEPRATAALIEAHEEIRSLLPLAKNQTKDTHDTDYDPLHQAGGSDWQWQVKQALRA